MWVKLRDEARQAGRVTMRVYRLERTDNAHGPFCQVWESQADLNRNQVRAWSNIVKRSNKLPVGSDDFAYDELFVMGFSTYIYGCDSAKQFYDWFAEDWYVLAQAGLMRAAIYEVPEEAVIKGCYQVAFDSDEAEYVGELGPGEYMGLVSAERITDTVPLTWADPTPGFVTGDSQ